MSDFMKNNMYAIVSNQTTDNRFKMYIYLTIYTCILQQTFIQNLSTNIVSDYEHTDIFSLFRHNYELNKNFNNVNKAIT